MSYAHAFNEVVIVEGGYSNNPLDPGGATKYGITEKVARANGYFGPMEDMDLPTASRIYKSQYWDLLCLDAVDFDSPNIAYELFDTAVNMGVGFAGRSFQRALNAFNRGARDFADVEVDGNVGPMTLHAFSSFMGIRGAAGETVLLRALNCLQGVRYIEIVEGRPTSEDFIFGWFVNRVR